MFAYQSKLVSIDGITTSATLSNMSAMFSSCTSLVSVPLFNTSGVTNASSAFWNCHALTSIPAFDFSSGTVSNVGNLFRNCEKVQSGSLAIYNQFNTSGLTPDYTAFFNCGIDTASGVAELEQIPGAWGGKLISTDPIAADTLRCKYSSLPTSGSWAVNAVDAYNGIFDLTLHNTWHNKAINGQPISVIGQGDCSTIASVRGVFYRKTNLTSVCDLSFPAATNAQDLFENCSALETVGNISLPLCTNVSGMFYGCSSLTSVPLFDTSHVTNFGIERGMLAGCTALKTVPLYNTSSATATPHMCDGCTAVESGALALYTQASTQATPPTTHTDMFKNCGANTTSGAAELAQIPSDWGGTMSA
jgi:surface protein